MRNSVLVCAFACSVCLSAAAEGGRLERVVSQMFESANASDEEGLLECFSENATVRIVSMEFRGKESILNFFKRDVWGGKYTIEKSVDRSYGVDVYLLFQPAGWDKPEPPILYRFYLNGNKIDSLVGTYR